MSTMTVEVSTTEAVAGAVMRGYRSTMIAEAFTVSRTFEAVKTTM
jgi:hypothetical protein